MAGRTGGKTNMDRDHEQNIGFHPQNASELAEYLLPHYERIARDAGDFNILDACSGAGALGSAFSEAAGRCDPEGITKVCLESVDEIHGQDIFEERGEYDLICCNPPWALKKALPIYNHLLSLLSPSGVLMFIVNCVFAYQGSDRAEQLKYQKFYFLPRWTFKPSGRPLLDCGVMVYHADSFVPRTAAVLRPYVPLKRVDTRLDEV